MTDGSRNPETLRVLVVSNMYPSDRRMHFGSFVRDSVKAMRAVGADVRVVAITDPRSGRARLLAKYAGLYVRAVMAAARGGYDVVHAHYLVPTGPAGRLCAVLRRVPLVLFAHGGDVLLAARGDAVGRSARRVMRSADVLVAPSAYLAEEMAQVAGGPLHQTEIVPMGVDPAVFCPGDREEARAHLGLRPTGPLLLFAGTLDANKGAGCEELLEALDAPSLATAALVVVGQGPWRPRLEERARAGSLSGRVDFRAQVERDELASLMRAADAVVVPSRRESLGLIALEARAVGTPVVAADVGGLPEHVESGVSGELYTPGSPARLRDALERVLSAPEGYALPALDVRYTLEGSARTVLEISRAAIDRKGRSR
ncbi:MAG: glycosyltransferase [Coriobacteriia bacterium]|jgi:glycosyltransferase involved in cell wall biosynthesis|nr:glycosyltransferase [Coriobacteriia bacterium]